VYASYGPVIFAYACAKSDSMWIWNATDGTVINKHKGDCLTVPLELEVWAGPLSGGSQAVVLLNRGDVDAEQITLNWTDIGFPADHSAVVRDLWVEKILEHLLAVLHHPTLIHVEL